MSDKFLNGAGLGALRTWILQKLGLKQDTLVSGTNIKTINNESVLGSGNIDIQGGVSKVFIAIYGVTTFAELSAAIDAGQQIAVATSANLQWIVPCSVISRGINTIDLSSVGSLSTDVPKLRRYIITDDNQWSVYNYAARGRVDSAMSDSSANAVENKTIKSYVDSKTAQATDSTLGTIKLNPNESITLNSSGQLNVGGRLGQMSNTTGVYSPKTINPREVGNGSFLLTEASGLKLGPKSLAVVTGSSLTVKSAAAGATTYLVNNSYENKIICAGIVGGILTLNEATAAENYVNVTRVAIVDEATGDVYEPSNAKYWTSTASCIIITTDASINPNSSVTSVRPYCCNTGFSNFSAGQQSGSDGGASVVVGQKVKSASGNACAIVGASIYNTGNGNAVFGRQHISRKNRSFLAGTGHDTTRGPAEGVAAFGQWSDIKSNTSFAIGNGTSATARSNSFEINTAGDTFVNGYLVLTSPNGTKYRISVDNNGNLVTSALQ